LLDTYSKSTSVAQTACFSAHLFLLHPSTFCLQGVRPGGILLVTYTKRMAVEAKERLQARRVPGAAAVVCGTVHSFCFRVLRQFHRQAVVLSAGCGLG